MTAAVAYAVLAWLSHSTASPPLFEFFLLLTIACGSWLAARSGRLRLRDVVLWAVAFRVIGFFGAPLYEDDFYRYLWDGRAFAVTGNPYAAAPAESFGGDALPAPFEEILSRINYPEIPTIYGPVCQVAFLLGHFIAPGQLWPLKLIFLAADTGIILLIWRMTASQAALVLYAWCPLIVKEVAFTAHTDILAAFFALLAFERVRAGKRMSAALALALAIASKSLALVLVPVILRPLRLKPVAILAGGLALLYAPFLIDGMAEQGGLRVFAREWEFNSFGFALLKSAFGDAPARLLSVALFAGLYLWIWKKRPQWMRPDVILGLCFLLTPVVNPWYLILLAPFVAMQPTAVGIAALASVLLSYATGQNLGTPDIGTFNHPWWVRPAEIAPVLLTFLWDWRTVPVANVPAAIPQPQV